MYHIKAYPRKRQLYIRIETVLDQEDLKAILFVINREVIRLDAGWTAMIDLRGMRVLEQRLTVYLRRMEKIFLDNGVSRIATLLDNTILQMQIRRLASEVGTHALTTHFTNEGDWKQFAASPSAMNPR